MTPLDASVSLQVLLLGALMGLLGQGARAVAGLKTMTDDAQTMGLSPNDLFQAARLFVSLAIGVLVGLAAALIYLAGDPASAAKPDWHILLGFAAAAYTGTDFLEAFISKYLAPPLKPGASVAALVPRAAPMPAPVTPAADPVAALTAAFKSCAPAVHSDVWVTPLCDAFDKYQLNSNLRRAAAIGQFLVEAGASFQEVVENLNYSTAARINQVFPAEFPTVASAQAFVHNPVGLGNRAYANKLGNGNEASGDGFKFRGRGLIQLTGRTEYSQFGATVGMTAEEAAQYCETPAGAAMSGCWYLSSRGCLPLADMWALSKITRLVNGAAMLGNDERIAFSNAFRSALGN